MSTLLIIEDNDMTRKSLGIWLDSMFPECRVLEAENAEKALELAPNAPPDVVLMDLRLSGMDGIEATRRIKARFPSAAVLIFTLYDAMEYRRDAAAAGAAGYVLKTRAKTDLAPMLQELIGRRKEDR